jgi:quinoprotein glucose dehydrogenase
MRSPGNAAPTSARAESWISGRGVERIAGRRGDYKETAPPAVAGDLVVVGSSILDSRYADAPSGVVRAFDARTGTLRWSWEPLSGVGGRRDDGTYVPAGAANTWATMTVDPERDLVFVPTGSASPDHWGGLRPGNNLYANSLVALRASTGEMQWHFQMVHHDLWDYDLASPPALITVSRAGMPVPAVAQGTKMGHVFILDRETGEPLFPVEERPAPASDVEGETASADPAVPVRPPPLVPQRLGPEDAWGLTPLDRTACRDRIERLRSEGIFTPPSRGGSIVYPGFLGGIAWGGMAFDPRSGLLVTTTNNIAMVATWFRRRRSRARRSMRGKGPHRAAGARALRRPARGPPLPFKLPCNPPPWGSLHAIDTATGEIRWEVPLGTLRDLARVPTPARWGAVNLGGSLITGGLVFIAPRRIARSARSISPPARAAGRARCRRPPRPRPWTYRARAGGRQYPRDRGRRSRRDGLVAWRTMSWPTRCPDRRVEPYSFQNELSTARSSVPERMRPG